MKLFDICDEVAQIEGGLMYGTIDFAYDNLMCAMKCGHPAEILDDILADVFWTSHDGGEPTEEAITELIEGLEDYKKCFKVKELAKPIRELKKYLEDKKEKE